GPDHLRGASGADVRPMSRRPARKAASAASQAATGMAVAAGLGGPDPNGGLAWRPIGGGGGAVHGATSVAVAPAGTAAAPGWEAAADAEGRAAWQHHAAPHRGPLPRPILAMLVGTLDLALLFVAGLFAAQLLA